MKSQCDVIIIGSGAGGGAMARHHAPSGKSILIPESGDWLKREALNWDPTAVFVENRYISKDTWGSSLMTHSEHSPLGARPLYIKDNSSSRSARPRDKE